MDIEHKTKNRYVDFTYHYLILIIIIAMDFHKLLTNFFYILHICRFLTAKISEQGICQQLFELKLKNQVFGHNLIYMKKYIVLQKV